MNNAIKKNDSTPKVVVSKIINAPREIVFDAWTKPEMMRHWYVGAKGTSISTVDLRVGGKYTNEMLIDPDAKHTCVPSESCTTQSFMHQGEYLEIKRPERIVFTWNSPSVQNTKVAVDLHEVKGGTKVVITHELSTSEECKSHQDGWTFALEGMATYLLTVKSE